MNYMDNQNDLINIHNRPNFRLAMAIVSKYYRDCHKKK